MNKATLQSFREEAQRQYTAKKALKRRRYKLARDLGFSPVEAQLLSGRNEFYITTLAQEQKAESKNDQG